MNGRVGMDLEECFGALLKGATVKLVLHFCILHFPQFHTIFIWYWPNARNNHVCWFLHFPGFYANLVGPTKM
jgi:hypothetical protein